MLLPWRRAQFWASIAWDRLGKRMVSGIRSRLRGPCDPPPACLPEVIAAGRLLHRMQEPWTVSNTSREILPYPLCLTMRACRFLQKTLLLNWFSGWRCIAPAGRNSYY